MFSIFLQTSQRVDGHEYQASRCCTQYDSPEEAEIELRSATASRSAQVWISLACFTHLLKKRERDEVLNQHNSSCIIWTDFGLFRILGNLHVLIHHLDLLFIDVNDNCFASKM